MHLFLRRLRGLIGKAGASRASYKARLDALLRKARPNEEFTFEYLVAALDPPSPEDLAATLSKLVERGELKQVIRVESPTTHGGLGDYPSIQEIPSEIHDWRTDEHIRVRPENLRVLYIPAWTKRPSLALL